MASDNLKPVDIYIYSLLNFFRYWLLNKEYYYYYNIINIGPGEERLCLHPSLQEFVKKEKVFTEKIWV